MTSLPPAAVSCPECGSSSVTPILYGFPLDTAFEAAGRGEITLGGCVVEDDTYACDSCGARFADDTESVF